jgi:hypothetical protein
MLVRQDESNAKQYERNWIHGDSTRQKIGSLATKNAFWHVRGSLWEIYRYTIGHRAAEGETPYETKATEQTVNTLRESEHSAHV